MNDGYILMTAMPPSRGHEAFIRWSSEFSIKTLYVMVCGRPTDPIAVQDRVEALRRQFLFDVMLGNKSIIFIGIEHDLPDYPEQYAGTVEEFDQLWVNKIKEYVDYDSEDFLFASDTYGARFANNLGLKFAPYDPNREVIKISGTKIRRNPFENFGMIVPAMQEKLRMTVTTFGAESCGKTTMAKHLADRFNSVYVPEWARPYLESLATPEVTDDRMGMIVRGQLAMQASARKVEGSPFAFQDTDLLSTNGYYMLYGGGDELDKAFCDQMAYENRSDLYIVMNSNIRFTPDPLRYGVTKRESDDQFWIDLLEEADCNYYYVQATNPIAQQEEVEEVVRQAFLKKNPVFGFERV